MKILHSSMITIHFFLFGQNGIYTYIDAQQRFLFQLYYYTQYLHAHCLQGVIKEFTGN